MSNTEAWQAYTQRGFRLVVGVALLSAFLYAVRRDFLPPCSELRAMVASMGFTALAGVVVLYTLTVLATLPVPPLAAVAGFLFGIGWGTAAALFSAVVAASLAFGLARGPLRQVVNRRLRHKAWFSHFEAAPKEQELRFVCLAHLSARYPAGPINHAFGLSPLRWSKFAMGSMAGLLPGTFVYAVVGHTICLMIAPVKMGLLTPRLIPFEAGVHLLVSLALLLGLSFLPVIINKIWPPKRRPAH